MSLSGGRRKGEENKNQALPFLAQRSIMKIPDLEMRDYS